MAMARSSNAGEAGFSINAELLRVIAYVMFWLMVLFAMFMTKVVMKQDISDSPLVEMFGYNNICVFWDYSPAREYTAMIYPFVEIPLAGYVVLSFLTTRELWRAGRISSAFYKASVVTFPIEFILAILFRMIFVFIAFENIHGHTLPFMGLQVALCLVASKNTLRAQELGTHACTQCVGPKCARVLSILYVLSLVSVTTVKLTSDSLTFRTGRGLFDVHTPSGAATAEAFDRLWMILAAIIPLFVAVHKMMTEPAITIKIDLSAIVSMPVSAAALPDQRD